MSRQFSLMHVAVGVVIDQNKKLLIAERPPNKTKAGFWEFPGGKVEEGETVLEALKREFQEEISICIDAAIPLIKVHYHNQECNVLLDTWIVTAYTGNPSGAEGQIIKWVDVTELDHYVFPEGNQKIIEILKYGNILCS
jgi:8-oxo-dGTP diphosphatase